MFVRTNNNLPADPAYPCTSFGALGYKVNDQGQIVSINPPHQNFPFFITDNERANQVHKEALHECARKMVAKELGKLGMKEVYLHGELGELVSMEKPNGVPFTRISVTNPEVLKKKKDVVIVIGEHTQDLGIWTYRSLVGDAGINIATAVGLLKKLEKMDFSGLPEQRDENVVPGVELHSPYESTGPPGLILLNPGQRLYSPQLHDIMTQTTWHARPRSNALAQPYMVDETYNYVPGQSTADDHIATCFEFIIPKLIDLENTRTYIVGISDGGEHFADYFNTPNQCVPNFVALHKSISGMAFMEPQFHASRMQFEPAMLDYLSVAWVKSPTQAKGEVVSGDDGPEIGQKGSGLGPSGMRTLSAGVTVDELVWPAVTGDVLDFFKEKAQEGNERAAVLAAAEKVKGR